MCAVTTKPLKMEQLTHILNGMEKSGDCNYYAITLLLMKATRVGDLLNTITIEDVYTESGELRENLEYNEGKTGKKRIIPIKGERLVNALNSVYQNIKHRKRTDHLFYSRKAKGKYVNSTISNLAVNQNLQKFVGQCGIEEVSTHAIRKTASRHLFDSGVPIETISELLNHSDCKISFRYIGINSTDISKALSFLEI